LYSSNYEAHYHSIHGAIQESEHVFIKEGLNRIHSEELKVLEIGLGTGLNALLTMREAIDKQINVDYSAIELYPIPDSIVEQLDYAERLERPELSESFHRIHKSSWGDPELIHERFVLTKFKADIGNCEFGDHIDLVYFDAFGPGTQEDLWTAKIFSKIYASMKIGGVLSTYCSKGDVRRAMISVGFKVKKVPGPPGKREMLVATK
jgi:tRNA U34 5-methylaminomethyl-2-thiouridine-forming methyltransferase MnmC